MATFDLTAKSTTGVGANSIAALPANAGTHVVCEQSKSTWTLTLL